jgi:hypothetical protein
MASKGFEVVEMGGVRVARVPISRRAGLTGDFMLIDEADLDVLCGRRKVNLIAGYPAIKFDGKRVRVHRSIMMPSADMDVDHINHCVTDNRRANLRIATRQQNMHNTSSHRDTSSRYLGVSWHRATCMWQAQITGGGKKKHLGRFNNELAAALAYDLAARARDSVFANPNFPSLAVLIAHTTA